MALFRKYVRNGERRIIGSVTRGFPDGVAVGISSLRSVRRSDSLVRLPGKRESLPRLSRFPFGIPRKANSRWLSIRL
jgi:hypothetical protein